DVVNPAAKEDRSSPLYGMPIIEVDRARTTFVLKRSMNPGFSGVENPLFYKPNTRMIFGDAKAVLSQLVGEFREAAAACAGVLNKLDMTSLKFLISRSWTKGVSQRPRSRWSPAPSRWRGRGSTSR